MQEEVRPVLTADPSDLFPGGSFVAGTEYERRTHFTCIGLGTEKVVRGDIVAVGKNAERRRPDVGFGALGNVVDDDARRCGNLFVGILSGFLV